MKSQHCSKVAANTILKGKLKFHRINVCNDLVASKRRHRFITAAHHVPKHHNTWSLNVHIKKKYSNEPTLRVFRKIGASEEWCIFWIFIMYYFLFRSQGNPSFFKGALRAKRHSIGEGTPSPPFPLRGTMPPCPISFHWKIYQVARVIYICIYSWHTYILLNNSTWVAVA